MQKEKSALKQIRKSLTPVQYQELVTLSVELKQLQNMTDPPEVVATIPTLRIQDLNSRNVEYPIEAKLNAYNSGATMLKTFVATSNGIGYIDFGIDISEIAYNDIELLPLFIRLIKETGTKDLSDVQLSRLIGTYTGGISIEILLQPVLPSGRGTIEVSDNSMIKTFLFLASYKCRNVWNKDSILE